MKTRTLLFILLLALVATTPTSAQGNPAEVVRSTRTVRIDGVTYALHAVARKETLYSIAKAYGVSVEAITKANPYLGERLAVNSTLLVPITEKQEAQQTEHPKAFIASPTAQPAVKPVDQESAQPSFPVVRDTVTTIDTPQEVGLIRRLTDRARGIELAMLLPFGGRSNEVNFVEFLCGSLLATEVLKDEGIAIRLAVHSTEAQIEKAHSLIASGALDRADALIGPVYDAPFEVVGAWATERRVPIISPLGGSGSLNNPYVVCAAPSEATKYEALRAAINNPTAKVSYIDCGANNDTEWAEAVVKNLPVGAASLIYQGKETKVTELSNLLSREGPNVIVLPTSNETLTEAILSRLSSINATARYDITVIGTPRWARFAAMNLELFFKLNVSYTTSYHADRTSSEVAQFFSRYIDTFGAIPSPYAMRGYDVTKWVGKAMHESGERFLIDLPQLDGAMLQTPYRFAQLSGVGSKFENVRWAWVTYRPNYTIEVR